MIYNINEFNILNGTKIYTFCYLELSESVSMH